MNWTLTGACAGLCLLGLGAALGAAQADETLKALRFGTLDAQERALDEVLAWVGLARRADQASQALDAEGRGRLAVARAVINRPDLLIADEPTGEAMLKLLSELNRAGTTMLIATRDTDLAEQSGAEVTHMLSARAQP